MVDLRQRQPSQNVERGSQLPQALRDFLDGRDMSAYSEQQIDEVMNYYREQIYNRPGDRMDVYLPSEANDPTLARFRSWMRQSAPVQGSAQREREALLAQRRANAQREHQRQLEQATQNMLSAENMRRILGPQF